jgi:hypothetical protein
MAFFQATTNRVHSQKLSLYGCCVQEEDWLDKFVGLGRKGMVRHNLLERIWCKSPRPFTQKKTFTQIGTMSLLWRMCLFSGVLLGEEFAPQI